MGAFEDLDDVIDEAGLQLMGLVPRDEGVSMMLKARALSPKSPAKAAFARIAARLDGEECPLVVPKK